MIRSFISQMQYPVIEAIDVAINGKLANMQMRISNNRAMLDSGMAIILESIKIKGN